MPSWFEPDEAHAAACIRRFGNGKLAVASCNRCKWMKNRHKWCRRCPWLKEADKSLGTWGLGCTVCAQSYTAKGVASSFATFVKGQTGILQVEDLIRHSRSDVHVSAAMHKSSQVQDLPPTSMPEKQPPYPTAAQIRLCFEVANTPLGAQSSEYERKAMLASRGDGANYPHIFNNRHTHSKIIKCAAKVLHLGKRKMFASFVCHGVVIFEQGTTLIEPCCRQMMWQQPDGRRQGHRFQFQNLQ